MSYSKISMVFPKHHLNSRILAIAKLQIPYPYPYPSLPSGNLTVCYWTWPIEIVDLPMKHGDFPVRYVAVYQRV